jgi:hypothetical protein
MRRELLAPDARRLTFGVLCALLACAAHGADAQAPAVSGYYQNVAVVAGAANREGASALDAERARLMWTPAIGALSLGVAYEQTLLWRAADRAGVGAVPLDDAGAGGDWLHLDWTVHEGTRVSWRQRLDRLNLSYARGPVRATLGRQAVSWATTLYLSPADPFVPFDPSDPFREYRTSIDAVRVQWYAGQLTVVDLVARGAETPEGRTLTAVVRGKTQLRGWELSAWGGALHDAAAAALGVTRTVAGSALRAEVEVRADTLSRPVVRAALGVDRRVSLMNRDLYAVVEYQHDPFGASRPSDLKIVAMSPAATRHELQVLGEDEVAAQGTYQVHPLVSVELLALSNLRDGSALVSPALSVSLSDEANLRVGVFFPAGAGPSPMGPRSEYGQQPVSAYLALSAFF